MKKAIEIVEFLGWISLLLTSLIVIIFSGLHALDKSRNEVREHEFIVIYECDMNHTDKELYDDAMQIQKEYPSNNIPKVRTDE